jgi:hypothetical protein
VQAALLSARRFNAATSDLLPRGGQVNGHVSVQLATYPGDGSRYVRHRDASPSSPHRRVTAIYYANRTHWDPSKDGGSLRIYGTGEGFARSSHGPTGTAPALGPSALPAGVSVGVHADEETYVDVAPCGDRLLVFLSHLEHEVSLRPPATRSCCHCSLRVALAASQCP